MKKCFLILLSVLLCAGLLAGCSCRHEWSEASCTLPKTCTKCRVAEGDAMGHSWKKADCVAPKTCSVCGLTEGDPLGHTWIEATCTTPKTCTICAATDGQPLEHTWEGEATLYAAPVCPVCGTEGETLPGYMAQIGLTPNVQPGQDVDFITATYVRPDLNTTGILSTSAVRIFPSDSTHRARSGYEWRCVDISILFGDSRFDMYGANVAYARANYYQDQKLKEPKKQEQFAITYNDREYWCLATYDDMGLRFDGRNYVYQLNFCVQVPAGYDGVVLAFHRGNVDIDGMHLHEVEDENMLLLQLA